MTVIVVGFLAGVALGWALTRQARVAPPPYLPPVGLSAPTDLEGWERL